MKRFLYSVYTKFAAAVLCVLLLTLGALAAADGFVRYHEENKGKESVYSFENTFEDSRYVAAMLESVENALFNAYITAAQPENQATLDQLLQERLARPYQPNMVRYYVSVNGQVYTNCGAASPEALKTTRFYRYAARDENGDVTFEGMTQRMGQMLYDVRYVNQGDTIVICTNISNQDAAALEKEWNRQAELVRSIFVHVLACALLALALMVYLVCAAGKNRFGDVKTLWLDSVWTEVHLGVMAAAVLGVAALCALLFDMYDTAHLPAYMLRSLTAASGAVGGAILLTSGLSLVRKVKCGTFLKTSVLCRVVLWVWRLLRRLAGWLWKQLRRGLRAGRRLLAKKSGVLAVAALLVYTGAEGFCGVMLLENGLGLILGILLFGAAAFVLAARGMDMDRIRAGAQAIRGGDLQYQITDVRAQDMRPLAEDINAIGEGLGKTVSAQLKAERLKTELITNVSHDLKTPLTSIISYTELLSQVENLPEEARDYAAVIAKKSQRLKNLTQDLFEVSKVQSGTETFHMERLDAALLLSQTLGEHDQEIRQSNLQFCVNTQKELFFTADGRKMSRALGNLIDNAVKYAMKGTRVFVSAVSREGRVVMEIKNVSAYPMDFDAEEITGRFVRGDSSRTTEGNGLGLAIARSYTEACGGTLAIVLDGDLFKVILTFPSFKPAI